MRVCACAPSRAASLRCSPPQRAHTHRHARRPHPPRRADEGLGYADDGEEGHSDADGGGGDDDDSGDAAEGAAAAAGRAAVKAKKASALLAMSSGSSLFKTSMGKISAPGGAGAVSSLRDEDKKQRGACVLVRWWWRGGARVRGGTWHPCHSLGTRGLVGALSWQPPHAPSSCAARVCL